MQICTEVINLIDSECESEVDSGGVTGGMCQGLHSEEFEDSSGTVMTLSEFASTYERTGVGWFTCRTVIDEKVVHCVKSMSCEGKGGVGGVCSECSALNVRSSAKRTRAAESLWKAVSRCCKRDERSVVGHGAKISKSEAKRRKRKTTRQIKRQARAILGFTTGGEVLNEQSLRRNYKAVATRLKYLAEQGAELGERNTNAVAIASNIIKNLASKGPTGRRHCPKTHALAGMLRAYCGGKAVYYTMAANLNLPHERTARRTSASSSQDQVFHAECTKESFEYVARVYKVQLSQRNIPLGKTPCALAEDETAVQQGAQWCRHRDRVVGMCGPLCAKECTHITLCRKAKCTDPHTCDPTGLYGISMGGDATFKEVNRGVGHSRLSTLARALVVNPLRDGLLRIPLVWTGTCKTFTSETYLRKQWDLIYKLWDEHLLEVLGPLIVHASDGDSTRRKAFLQHGLSKSLRNDQVALNNIDGFKFRGSRPDWTRGESLLCDMDFIHNAKKLFNPLASPNRQLTLGDTKLSMEHLYEFFEETHSAVCGATRSDCDRRGMRAMDFPSVQRVVSKKFRTELSKFIIGSVEESRPSHPNLRGMEVYLGMLHRYITMFLSRTMSLRNRIKAASYVNAFLLIWQGKSKQQEKNYNEDEQTIDWMKTKVGSTYISREAKLDVSLSCHFIVLLIKKFRENKGAWGNLNIPFWRLGSDCCEDLFSSLGSFVKNKRTYTILEGLVSIRAQLNARCLAAEHGLHMYKRRGGLRATWDEDEEMVGDQTDWPDDNMIKESWEAGADEARGDLEGLGVAPLEGEDDRYWKEPWTQLDVPSSSSDVSDWLGESRSEEELDEELGLVDGDGDGVECGGGGAGDERKNNDGGSGSDEGGGDGSGSDGDGDGGSDNDGGGSGVHDLDGDERDAAEMICRSLSEIIDNGEAGEVNEEEPTRITTTMWVEELGALYHKATICSWFSEGVEKLSTDRGVRVEQAGNAGRSDFKIATSKWTVQLGQDVAVKCEDTDGTMHAQIGRICRMRRKYTTHKGTKTRVKWVNYHFPVDLCVAKKEKHNMFFDLCYYSFKQIAVKTRRNRGRKSRKKPQKKTVYEYGRDLDPTEVQIETIICPVAMVYEPGTTNLFTLPSDVKEVIKRGLNGEVWDY